MTRMKKKYSYQKWSPERI